MVMPADAVFEGGGVKGIGLVGALDVAEERGYTWRYVAGTSAGAIVASLVAAGYKANEIRIIIEKTDFKSFLDKGLLTGIPLAGPLLNVLINKGLYRGKAFEDWIRGLLAHKGIRTFKQLKVPGVTDERFAYKLRVIAADLTREKLLILPQDIKKYGTKPDDLDVATAIRMSMSIPFFYQPVKTNYNSEGKNLTCYIVDGGVLSNFPVWLFDGARDSCPTFGFRLRDPFFGNENEIKGPLSMYKALFSTMMEAHDERYIDDAHFARSILIPCLGVRTTDFNISREKQRALYKSGQDAAERFYDKWDYGNYLDTYKIY